MATLVLTVVGGMIGGPAGAAIGGLIGSAADHALFRAPRREGPRLAELAVQTSSYGAPIPRVFGRMRVAGSIIWATDLQEHRDSSGGGKGRPATTSYSYTASFAVALSSRPVREVGRIWADGRLVRGAEGDWKVTTGFRLHTGDEAQPADPLIASLEGIGATPAHRGTAYAVFEDLELADFGNRIPSLTFEVIADAAPPTIGTIVVDATAGIVCDTGGGAATLDGFSAYGDRAAVIADLLARAAGGWIAPAADRLGLYGRSDAVTMLDDAGFGEAGVPPTVTNRPIDAVPRTLTLAHYDPERDFQTGLQSARRPGAGFRSERVEMPAAIHAGPARTMAEAMLARAEIERCSRTVTLDLGAAGIAPGRLAAITGEPGTWRVTATTIENMTVALELIPVAPAAIPATSTPGRIVADLDRAIGATIVAAFEIPPLDDELLTRPRLSIAAAGTGPGWRRAALLYSLDEGATWLGAGSTAGPAVIGTTVMALPGAEAGLIDRANSIEVDLLHEAMALTGIEPAAIGRGENLALLGGELIQFLEATRIGPRRWRLSHLVRGRRGMSAPHAPHERFVLLDRDTLATITLPSDIAGRTIRVLASGVGDDDAAEAAASIRGVSIAPPSPVHLRAAREGDHTVISWTRRSRLGFGWRNGSDVPLAEEREAYRVEIRSAGALRVVETAVARIALTAGESIAGATVGVSQLGTGAASSSAAITVSPVPIGD